MSTSSSVRYDSRWGINRVVFLMTSRNGDSGLVTSSYNRYEHRTMCQRIFGNLVLKIEVSLWRPYGLIKHEIFYRFTGGPTSRHEIGINTIPLVVKLLVWSIIRLAIEVGGIQLVFKYEYHISCVEFVSLFHPPRWNNWFRSSIRKLVAFPGCITRLYWVNCLVQVIGITPWNVCSCRVLRCVFHNCGAPKVQTFQNIWLGWLKSYIVVMGPIKFETILKRCPWVLRWVVDRFCWWGLKVRLFEEIAVSVARSRWFW